MIEKERGAFRLSASLSRTDEVRWPKEGGQSSFLLWEEEEEERKRRATVVRAFASVCSFLHKKKNQSHKKR